MHLHALLRQFKEFCKQKNSGISKLFVEPTNAEQALYTFAYQIGVVLPEISYGGTVVLTLIMTVPVVAFGGVMGTLAVVGASAYAAERVRQGGYKLAELVKRVREG